MGKCGKTKGFFWAKAAIRPPWGGWSLPRGYSETSCPYMFGALRWGTGKTSQHHLHAAAEEREATVQAWGVLYLGEHTA